jgi:hypothetical protein
VNIANNVTLEKKKRGKKKVMVAESNPKVIDPSADLDGSQTNDYLKNTRRLLTESQALMLLGFNFTAVSKCGAGQASSLGLHPAVYFYSATGRHQPTSFLAVVNLMKEFETKNYFATLTRHRRKFEDFLIAHKDFPNQIVVSSGSGLKGYAKPSVPTSVRHR